MITNIQVNTLYDHTFTNHCCACLKNVCAYLPVGVVIVQSDGNPVRVICQLGMDTSNVLARLEYHRGVRFWID